MALVPVVLSVKVPAFVTNGVVTEVENVGSFTVLRVTLNPPPAVPVLPPVKLPEVFTLILVLP